MDSSALSLPKQQPRLRASVIAFVALLPLLSGCGEGTGSSGELLQAQTLFSEGKQVAAVIELKSLLQKTPDNGQARALLGRIESERGNSASAIKELNRAIDLGVPTSEVLLPLGRAYLQGGFPKRMLTELAAEALPAGPQRALAINLRAAAMVALKQLDQADEAYRQALQQEPKNIEAVIGRATIASLRQDYDEARKHFDTAIVIAPQRVDTWLLIGDLEYRHHHLSDALGAYQRALEINPDSHQAKANVALTLVQLGRMDDAKRIADELRPELQRAPAFQFLEASIAFDERDYKRANEHLETVIQINPDHVDALLMLGATHLVLQNFQQAQSSLSRVLILRPDNARARLLLADAQAAGGLGSRAKQTLQPLLAKGFNKETLFSAARIFLQLGDTEAAQQFLDELANHYGDENNPSVSKARQQLDTLQFERALDTLTQTERHNTLRERDLAAAIQQLRQHRYSEYLEHTGSDADAAHDTIKATLRGIAYAGRGETDQARDAFEQALALQPDNLVALKGLASIDLQAGKYDDAERRFHRVFEFDPEDISAILALARIARHQGDDETLRKMLEKARELAPGDPIPPLALGRMELRLGNTDAALTSIRIAHAIDPEDPVTLRLLAQTLSTSGQRHEARVLLRQLLSAPPPLQDAAAQSQRDRDRSLLASLADADGDSATARTEFLRGIDEDPSYVPFYTGLIALETRDNNFDAAVAAARRLQQAAPESADGYALEGDIERMRGERDSAIAAYQKALPLATSGKTARSLAETLTRQQRADEAIALLEQRLRSAPDDAPTRMLLASILSRQNQHQEAGSQYRQVLLLTPDHPLVLNQLALAEQKSGDDHSALNHARRAYALAPHNPLIADTLGWLLFNNGDNAAALDKLQAAARTSPNNPEIAYHLAAALAADGNPAAALALLVPLNLHPDAFGEASAAAMLRENLSTGKP